MGTDGLEVALEGMSASRSLTKSLREDPKLLARYISAPLRIPRVHFQPTRFPEVPTDPTR